MSDRPTVAVVGAGQLGSRHLQSLALLDRKIQVQVVDPNPASLQTAKRRLAEIPEGARLDRVDYLTGMAALAPEIDLAIVATLADVREKAVAELLEKRRVRSLILEKVLFQDPVAYDRVGALLAARGAKAWVNCPRRLSPGFRALRERLAGGGLLEIAVDGTNWGLASNAIHFLDLAAYFCGRTGFRISAERLDRELVQGKRPGFVEFTGTLTADFAGACLLTMTARSGDVVDLEIRVSSGNAKFQIRELMDTCWVSEAATGWIRREESFPRMVQSRFGHEPVAALLDGRDCGLTPYAESAALHRPMIEAFLAHLGRCGRGNLRMCPIT